MMRRNTQVSQHTIHLVHTMITQKILQITEITPHKRKPHIVQPNNIRQHISILVKTKQTATTQTTQNLTTVATATKRNIHIHTTITQVQTINTLLQQHRNMIHQSTLHTAHS